MSADRVDALIRCQHGMISRRQALANGLTESRLKARLRSGELVRACQGVYRHRGAPTTWHNKLMMGCLAVDGLAFRGSAAVIQELDGYRKGRPCVLVPRGKGGRGSHVPGVSVHESNDFELARPVVRQGIPCTGLARTVLDVAARSSDQQLGAAVDALVRTRRLTIADLYSVLAKHGGRGRPGCRRLRKVLDQRGGEERVPLSDWSRMVGGLLRSADLPEPVYEYQVKGPDGEVVGQIDCGYPQYTVAIELDSVECHFNLESFHRDRARANELILCGWTLLTFTWRDYVSRPRRLCALVEAALRQNGWAGR